jgi:Ca2+-transporting ATPase
MKSQVSIKATLLCAASLGAFLIGYNQYSYEVAVSMCFFTLVAAELLVSYAFKTDAFSGFGKALFANKTLNISMGLSLLVLIAVIYIPFLAEMFSAVPLSAVQFTICTAFVLLFVVATGLVKGLSILTPSQKPNRN